MKSMISMTQRSILGLFLKCVEHSRNPGATDAGGAISAKSAETDRAWLSTVSVTAGVAISVKRAETVRARLSTVSVTAGGAISVKRAETVRARLSTVSVTAGGAICWLPAETEPRTVSARLREMAPQRRK
ncbi:unnamed protein product [Xylocopa violacea]|uniref:Uncharacterized protein n=1 Tax=Xylocopa violacea TaxID=135666 RepID=A0ABP1NM68_XYLVO